MGLLNQIFKPKPERDYERAMRGGHYEQAIQVADEHRMDPGRTVEAAKAWLEREYELGNFETAAQIGQQYRLSKKRTAEAAEKALQAAIKGKQLEKAVALIDAYELDRRKLIIECDRLFQHEMDGEKFLEAADVARRGGLDRERLEKAVSRAFKKALREHDDESLAEIGQTYGDMELDWTRVKQAMINLVVTNIVGQVYDKAIDLEVKYNLSSEDMARALSQAAAARFKYLQSLQSSMVVKEGVTKHNAPSEEEIFGELMTGYQREREKRT